VYGLEDSAAAYTSLAKRTAEGKVVISFDSARAKGAAPVARL
jgi:hypothetical protein